MQWPLAEGLVATRQVALSLDEALWAVNIQPCYFRFFRSTRKFRVFKSDLVKVTVIQKYRLVR